MSRRARQKRYTPKRINPHAAFHAMESRQPIDHDAVRSIAITARTALERLRRGEGTQDDLLGLGFASNVALLLSEQGFGAECEDDIKRAQAALLRADNRYQSLGRAVLDGPGLGELRELLDIYEQQLEAALVGDMRAVLREIERRVDAGLVATSPEEFRGAA